MQFISTNKAAQALGHYSQAVSHGGVLYISGQLPIYPNGELELGDISAQTQVALENIKGILEASNATLQDVLKVTIFISDISLWAEANQVYAAFFGSHKPARAAVPVGNLPKGFLIEIEAIARG